ncbi:MAG: hypothetical protein QNJ97_21785 [Myxococcota bacterium]|nr:hypothetical protein [Myxococcota bacterium]
MNGQTWVWLFAVALSMGLCGCSGKDGAAGSGDASPGDAATQAKDTPGQTAAGEEDAGTDPAAELPEGAETDSSIPDAGDDEDDEYEEEDEDDEEDEDALLDGAGKETSNESAAKGLTALVAEIKNTQARLALREREVIAREQLLASLETAVIEKNKELKQIKKEVIELLGQLQEKYGAERAKYEAAEKKKAAQREKVEQERIAKQKQLMIELADAREKHIAHLVATLKGMRSSAGASMIASMNDTDAVAVLRQLSPRQAAGILGGMEAVRAANLAQAMLGPPIQSDKMPSTPSTTTTGGDPAKETPVGDGEDNSER